MSKNRTRTRTSRQQQETDPGHFTSPQDFYEELAQGDRTAFLHCRGYGHSWGPHSVSVLGSARRPVYEVTVVCGSCNSLRTDWLDHFGEVLRDSVLHYPTGYVADGSQGALRGTRGLAKLMDVTKTGRYTQVASMTNKIPVRKPKAAAKTASKSKRR